MTIRITSRVPHHTNEQIVEMVRDVVRIADDAGLDERDRETLLPSIFLARLPHHLEIEQADLGALGAMLGRG